MLAKRAAPGTTQLDKEAQTDLPLLPFHPYGFRQQVSNAPQLPEDLTKQCSFSWLIELERLGREMRSIRVEIKGNVVLGMKRPGSSIHTREKPD
jgi:hypothetical protein